MSGGESKQELDEDQLFALLAMAVKMAAADWLQVWGERIRLADRSIAIQVEIHPEDVDVAGREHGPVCWN